jgi:hypothetical protein
VVQAPATVAAGLASLDFELPRRGRIFRFTTPRGDAVLTARVVEADLLWRLGGLLAIGLIAATAWGAARLVRSSRFHWRVRPLGAGLLAALGLLMICAGILPIAGLLLLVIGLVLAVRPLLVRGS